MEHETIGVISDIHANIVALDAVLEDMPPVETIVCCGDIIGILGSNHECVQLVQDECSDVVLGNHDARVRPDFAYNPSFPSARDEMGLVAEQLTERDVDWIAGLPDRVETDQFVLAHARPFYYRDPGYPCHGFAEGDYGIRPRDFTRVGPNLDGKVALLGHTHEQHALDCSKFEGQSGLVVNPGSVGVPWDGMAEYATVNLDTHEYDLCSVEYDTQLVRERIEEVGLDVDAY